MNSFIDNDAFGKRMELRKQREIDEQAEREKSAVTGQYAYTANLTLQIVSHNYEMAKETLNLLEQMLENFEDLKNVVGRLDE